MNSRIQLILKTKNISASKFADEIGVQRSSISHILSGRNNPSLDFIQKTLMKFPDISPDWILTGKGSMYMQPDLFNTATEPKNEPEPVDDDLNDSEEDIPEEIQKVVVKEKIETEKPIRPKIIKTTERIPEKSELRLSDHTNKVEERKIEEKKIERIIIFYSDKTCMQYTME